MLNIHENTEKVHEVNLSLKVMTNGRIQANRGEIKNN